MQHASLRAFFSHFLCLPPFFLVCLCVSFCVPFFPMHLSRTLANTHNEAFFFVLLILSLPIFLLELHHFSPFPLPFSVLSRFTSDPSPRSSSFLFAPPHFHHRHHLFPSSHCLFFHDSFVSTRPFSSLCVDPYPPFLPANEAKKSFTHPNHTCPKCPHILARSPKR